MRHIVPSLLIENGPQATEVHDSRDRWDGITSSSKRRKIQNRLNQRARRTRERAKAQQSLQVAPLSAAYSLSQLSETEVLSRNPGERVGGDLPRAQKLGAVSAHDRHVTCLLGQAETRAMLIALANQSYKRYQIGSISRIDLPGVVRFNIFHAFATNARVLGFDDAWLTYDAVSPFNAKEATISSPLVIKRPQHMNPISLQLAVEHHPWIDFFPCQRLRYNLLAALIPGEELIDEDELCRDVVDGGRDAGIGAAAVFVWGNPWEPGGWEFTEMFVKKWGWLLNGCHELIEATNGWRAKRGLEALNFQATLPMLPRHQMA